ncbi:MAG: hypothetical protein IIA45_03045 [Bacteroidetes bacterium]|nr:hypothetical protein [Bacteroidota bacterium]
MIDNKNIGGLILSTSYLVANQQIGITSVPLYLAYNDHPYPTDKTGDFSITSGLIPQPSANPPIFSK